MKIDLFRAVLFHLVIGGGLVWAGFRVFKRCRLIVDTPRSKSASAPQGFVELHGYAWPLEAPFLTARGHYAVYYSLELQRKESEGSGKNRRTVWRTKATAGTSGPFLLVDPTGLTLIDEKGITRELENATTSVWTSLNDQQKTAVMELIADKAPSDFPPSGSFFGLFSSSYRIAEQAIYMGSPVHASGHFRCASDSESHPTRVHGLTKFFASTMNEAARTERNIDSRIDRNQDGKVSVSEAIDGYSSLARHAWDSAGDVSEEREFMIHGSLEGSLDHELHISDKREEHLVRSLKLKYRALFAIGSIFLASALTLPLNGEKPKNSATAAQSQSRVAAQAQPIAEPQTEQQAAAAHPERTAFHNQECRANARACWEQFTNALQPFDVNDVPKDMKLAVVKLQLHDLHYACEGGANEACEVLLSVPGELFGLTATHQSGYARRGCELGSARLCQWRAPASK